MSTVHGDADVAAAATLFAEPTRAKILAALSDGRALPASLLASEAGVAASTASEHLARLVEGGLLLVEKSGRHRYFRLADDRVAAAIEALSVLAPQQPVRSLRQSTRAAAQRRARTCYDHLAGRLGVAVTESLLTRQALARTDGRDDLARRDEDALSSPVSLHPYRLGPNAAAVFGRLGVDLSAVEAGSRRRPVLRFCVDWTEQRHHLAGALGAAVLTRMRELGWVKPLPVPRAVDVTPEGRTGLADLLGVQYAG
jgi:DNA-binding transcriptional ArsR family regulator